MLQLLRTAYIQLQITDAHLEIYLASTPSVYSNSSLIAMGSFDHEGLPKAKEPKQRSL